MGSKKAVEYNMRDDFSFPVFVSNKLTEIGGIKGIDPNDESSFNGYISRQNGETYLDIANYQSEDELFESEFFNDTPKVVGESQPPLYVNSWNGEMIFVCRKYFQTGSNLVFSNQHFSVPVSRWKITDFSLVSEYRIQKKVNSVSVYIDYVHNWLGIFNPVRDLSTIKSLEFENIMYQGKKFTILIGAEGTKKIKSYVVEQTSETYINISFEKEVSKDYVYQLIIVIRNFFEIVLNLSTNINRVILNKSKWKSEENHMLGIIDSRENWFFEQTLPSLKELSSPNFDLKYKDIAENLGAIFRRYLSDEKLQDFVRTFLLINQFNTPLSTQIVTLVSAVESFYVNTKYSNGNMISNAINKILWMAKLVDLEKFKNKNHIQNLDVKELASKMKNARDYFVHGMESKKIVSEVDLVPDLLIFKLLIREALVNMITLKVQKNN